MQKRHFVVPLEIKAVGEDGQFEGEAAVYGNLDSYREIIESGAVTKSLAQRQGRVLLLADHDARAEARIGIGYLADSSKALTIRGILNLGDQDPIINALARKVYSDLKFYQAHGYRLGLSIGFFTVVDKIINGVRHLLEIDVVEVSVVSFPANDLARVEAVRTQKGTSMAEAKAADFASIFERISLWQQWEQMVSALWRAMDSCLMDSEMDHQAKMDTMQTNLSQFGEVMMAWFDRLVTSMEPQEPTQELSTDLQALKSKMATWSTMSHTERKGLLDQIEASFMQAYPEEFKRLPDQSQDDSVPLEQLTAFVNDLKAFVAVGDQDGPA